MGAAKNKLLTVLSEAEQYALYGLPDFDDAQRLEYLALTETELALAVSRPGSHAQVYCVLQIGFFKAKHAFFRFGWSDVEDDLAFVLSRYFNGESFERRTITKHEHYTQCRQIAKLFRYRLWSASFRPQLAQQAMQIVRRDVTPGFVAAELIVWLYEHKIIRPGYTTLQKLISETLSAERRRIGDLLAEVLDDRDRAALEQLIVRDDTLSELAVLRQDAKDFRWRQMIRERGFSHKTAKFPATTSESLLNVYLRGKIDFGNRPYGSGIQLNIHKILNRENSSFDQYSKNLVNVCYIKLYGELSHSRIERIQSFLTVNSIISCKMAMNNPHKIL